MGSATTSRGMADRRLRLGVLLAGLLGTALILGALAFSRGQMETDHQGLDRITVDLNQQLQLLNEAQTGYRQSEEAFASGTQASSSQASAAAFSKSLADDSQAKSVWEQFKARPVRFEGEDAARNAIDAGWAAADDAAQPLGVAVLSSSPDAGLIAQLKVAELELSTQVQDMFDHLEADFYLPELNREMADLGTQSGQSVRSISAALGFVAVLGVLLTFIGYRRAARIERAASRERNFQQQAAAENALDAQLQHALEMADTEDQVFHVIDRALTNGDAHPTDFLLGDSGVTHFNHVVSAADDCAGRCPVPSPNECPVTKHGQALIIADSTALDACTYLLERDHIAGSAVCIPVSIAGHAIGVMHEAYSGSGSTPPHRIRQLEIVARKAGERLGMLRSFARSETEAHTDPLTGLLNRRSLEGAVERLNRESVDYSVAFADLDHFKVLNDTYGHDAGDRALRLFCSVLRTNVRPDDVVSRYGGEEFVVVLPRCTPDEAVPVLQRVQESLADTVRADGIPPFTVSIGVASTHRGGTFEEILLLADGCLLRAKDQGRNRIVVAGAAEPILGPATTPVTVAPSEA
jgi:diguanylate cyclase (GGDEF)-like protein